jgi:hypothetical protein
MVDLARVMGTVAALVGIVLTAPAAFGVLWEDWRASGARVAQRLRAALSRRPGGDVFMHGETASLGFGAGLDPRVVTRSSGFARPGPDAPVADHLEALWARMVKFATEIEGVRSASEQRSAELREQISGVEARITGTEERLGGRIDAVHARVRSSEERSIRISAYGLPAILVGILLTGLPDGWVAQPWVIWPLVGAALVGMAYGVGRLWAERVAG